jgi:predicted RNA-binding Zn-ribbon protein involved in translation (DUF1610 family)
MSAIVDDCGACGVDVVEGVDHDCPVLGSVVQIRRDVAECHTILDDLFPEDARKPASRPATCSTCGWPVIRTQPSCPDAGRHG